MLALYIVAGVVFFILLVFSIPVDMAFEVGGPGAARSRMRVGWLFGLLGKEFGRRRKKPRERESKREKKKRSATPFLSLLVTKGVAKGLLKLSKREKKKRSANLFLSLLLTKGVARGLLKLSRRILSGVRVRHLDARVGIGLDDPAVTGMLYSALWPVLVPLTYNSSARVRMELSFEGPALDLTASGSGCIQMVWYVLLFALSPAGLRAMKRMVMRR